MSSQPRHIEPTAGSVTFGPGGERYTSKLSSADTAGAYFLIEIDIPAAAGPPLHRHTREDELFIVLEGEVAFWVSDRTIRAQEGAVVFAPRDIPHTYKNCSADRARMLVLVSPPVAEPFFRNFGAPLPGTTTAPPDDVIIQRILTLAPEFGIEILGPSPL